MGILRLLFFLFFGNFGNYVFNLTNEIIFNTPSKMFPTVDVGIIDSLFFHVTYTLIVSNSPSDTEVERCQSSQAKEDLCIFHKTRLGVA